MVNLRADEEPWQIPVHAPRAVLLDWVRANCPDMRIQRQRLQDNRLACLATFSFQGEEFQIEAVENDDVRDAADEIVRRCARLLWHRMGLRSLDEPRRQKLIDRIYSAVLRGDVELADRLSAELVMLVQGRG